MAGLLEGVKIIGFEQVVGVPAATAVLADWGADVIKIEPTWGDWQRSLVSFNRGPLLFHLEKGDIELHFEFLNRSKRSVVLNLRTERGRSVLYQMLENADIFATNYSLDVLKKFGLDYASLKEKFPGLIHFVLTGYGSKGPKASDRGYDYVAAWSYGGLMDLVSAGPDYPPPISRPGMMDIVASAHITSGLLAALYYKQKTGKGQGLELSLYHTAAWTLGLDIQTALFGHPQPKWDRKRAPNPMYTSYRCKDRWCMMCHPTQEYWEPFCRAIGKPEWINDPRYATMESREQHSEELVSLIDQIMATKTWAEWEVEFRKYDLIASGNQTIEEILKDEQAVQNNFYTDIEHPVVGRARLLNSPVQFSETPATIRWAAPQLGEHTEEVLLEMGYSWEEINKLKEEGVIP
ncbi:MAG: CoA transferase [Dehalococcoidales bacterium]|jgi:crotonobetainyl-CoA:carnitine CoA-transferase CaiB-like acyl-CoA transferase|nr:CoA transferase [Dehalococcoidales bacterium]